MVWKDGKSVRKTRTSSGICVPKSKDSTQNQCVFSMVNGTIKNASKFSDTKQYLSLRFVGPDYIPDS